MKDVESKLIDWVAERNDGNPDFRMDRDTDLYASGYLDSLGFVGLLMLVEEMSGKKLADLDVNPLELKTVRIICETFF